MAAGVHWPIVSLRTGRCWALESATLSVADTKGCIDAWTTSPEVGLLLTLDAHATPSPLEAIAALATALDQRDLVRGRLAIKVVGADDVALDTLVTIASACRSAGFLVATEEVGVGHPHIERVAAIVPDVLEIDARLFGGLARSSARLEACRAVMELARSIGALVIVNGVGTVEDLGEDFAMLGINLFRGPLIGAYAHETRPAIAAAELAPFAQGRAAQTRGERGRAAAQRTRGARARLRDRDVSRRAVARTQSDTIASEIARDVAGLEALYVLDHKGVQLTATWLAPDIVARNGFAPTQRGADLGLKDYFLEVGHGTGAYVSRPYVSMASGRLSVTHSRRVRLCDGTNVVVCCDVPSAAL